MLSRGKHDAGLRDRLPDLIAARVRNEHGAGYVLAVDFDMERSAGGCAGDAEIEAIGRGLWDVDGVVKKLAGLCIGDVISAAKIGCGADGYIFVGTVRLAFVDRHIVDKRDTDAAVIKILSLYWRR